MDGMTEADWIKTAATIAGVLITVIVAIVIARWQAANRRKEERESDVGALLDLGGEIVWKVQNRGPYTAAGFDELKLNEFAIKADQLSARGPRHLREPMVLLAGLAEDLRLAAVPADSGGPGSATAATATSATVMDPSYRLAVQQGRTANELQNTVKDIWSLIGER